MLCCQRQHAAVTAYPTGKRNDSVAANRTPFRTKWRFRPFSRCPTQHRNHQHTYIHTVRTVRTYKKRSVVGGTDPSMLPSVKKAKPDADAMRILPRAPREVPNIAPPNVVATPPTKRTHVPRLPTTFSNQSSSIALGKEGWNHRQSPRALRCSIRDGGFAGVFVQRVCNEAIRGCAASAWSASRSTVRSKGLYCRRTQLALLRCTTVVVVVVAAFFCHPFRVVSCRVV